MSLEGRLEDLGLTDILQIIGLSKRSGVLTVVHKGGTGRLVFHEGNVLYATSDRKPRFGNSLVQKGVISSEQLEQALSLQQEGGSKKPLGTLLIESGAVTSQVIEKLLGGHILDVVKDLLGCDSGSFSFDLGGVGDEEIVLPIGLSVEFILLEGARLQDEEGRSPAAAADAVMEKEPVKAAAPAAASPRRDEKKKAAASPKKRKDLALLTAMIEEISGSSNKSEIILMVLRFASEIVDRAVIFLVKAEEVVGLGQSGLVLKNGSADQMIRSVKVPLREPSCFKSVVERGQTSRGALEQEKWNEYLVKNLGGTWPKEALIMPLMSDGKVVAILYGDNCPRQEEIGNIEGLEAFMRVAGFALGKALLERRLEAKQSERGGG